MSEERIVIDLNDKSLNERLYTDFSYKVNRMLLDLYHAGADINPTIRGTQAQIESFFKAIRPHSLSQDVSSVDSHWLAPHNDQWWEQRHS